MIFVLIAIFLIYILLNNKFLNIINFDIIKLKIINFKNKFYFI